MKDELYLNIAKELSALSKCQYLKVACIVIQNGRIVATGVNGTLPNHPNCCDLHFDTREQHRIFSDAHEVHAEMNAILELTNRTLSNHPIDIYVTHSPCVNCFKHLIALQRNGLTVNKIVYGEKYWRLVDGDILRMEEFANKSEIKLYGIQL